MILSHYCTVASPLSVTGLTYKLRIFHFIQSIN